MYIFLNDNQTQDAKDSTEKSSDRNLQPNRTSPNGPFASPSLTGGRRRSLERPWNCDVSFGATRCRSACPERPVGGLFRFGASAAETECPSWVFCLVFVWCFCVGLDLIWEKWKDMERFGLVLIISWKSDPIKWRCARVPSFFLLLLVCRDVCYESRLDFLWYDRIIHCFSMTSYDVHQLQVLAHPPLRRVWAEATSAVTWAGWG